MFDGKLFENARKNAEQRRLARSIVSDEVVSYIADCRAEGKAVDAKEAQAEIASRLKGEYGMNPAFLAILISLIPVILKMFNIDIPFPFPVPTSGE